MNRHIISRFLLLFLAVSSLSSCEKEPVGHDSDYLVFPVGRSFLSASNVEVKLTPLEKDSFRGDVFFINELAFTRDEKGRVNGFTVSNGRTRGILFEKI